MIDSRIKKIIQSKKLEKHEKLSSILKYIFIEICNINQKKYFIIGSYGIREFREISDLDINLELNEFYKLKHAIDKGFGHLEIYNNQIRWFFDMTEHTDCNDFSIEAFQKFESDGFPNSKFSLKYLTKNDSFDIDKNHHQFFNLQTLLSWKKTMNRDKDQNDIILIKSLNKSKRI